MESARALAGESGKGRIRRGLKHPRRVSLKRPETSDTFTGSEEKRTGDVQRSRCEATRGLRSVGDFKKATRREVGSGANEGRDLSPGSDKVFC